MASQNVYLWGFSPDSLQGLPKNFIPTHLSTPNWPTTAPVIVHGYEADEFLELAEEYPLENGRLPDAILYLPKGMRASVAMQSDFNATVKAEDWTALREWLTCPQQFLMAEMADELPASFVWGLDKPVEALTPPLLPLSREVTKHLATCGTCWSAFKSSLEGRHKLQRRLLCPSTERLAAYVRKTPDAWVERHLQSCTGCRGQLAILTSIIAPDPWREWIKIPLKIALIKVQEQGQQIRDALTALLHGGLQQEPIAERYRAALITLLNGTLQQGLVPAGIKGLAQGDKAPPDLAVAEELAEELEEEDAIMLSQSEPRKDVTLALEEEALWIGELYGSGLDNDKDFRVEIWRGNKLLWSSSKDEDGVLMPWEMLLEAMLSDEGQLIIKAKEV